MQRVWARYIGAIFTAIRHTAAILATNMGNMSDMAIAIQVVEVAGVVARAARIAGHLCRIRCCHSGLRRSESMGFRRRAV